MRDCTVDCMLMVGGHIKFSSELSNTQTLLLEKPLNTGMILGVDAKLQDS